MNQTEQYEAWAAAKQQRESQRWPLTQADLPAPPARLRATVTRYGNEVRAAVLRFRANRAKEHWLP